MKWLKLLHGMVWGPWTLVIFLGTGLFLTVKCRFFQFRGFSFWWNATAGALINNRKNNRRKKQEKNGTHRESISQFQSVCTALAATVGTGNIAGVATALTAGGPGALFWMWISAFIGMITAYAETCLGICCRLREPDGRFLCGPFLYMEHGLKVPFMAILYSALCVMCALGMGSMVQANSAVTALSFTFDLPLWLLAVCFTLLTGAVIRGGIQSIGRTAERLIPAAAAIYVLFSLIVILSSLSVLPGVLRDIFDSAFHIRAAAGGAGGFLISRSVRYGIARGVFSNEAGLGTLAVLHGPAEHTTPEKQGMWAMFEVFFDTIVLCTLTALVILCMAETASPGLDFLPYEGSALAAWAFKCRLGNPGEAFISASMAVFAFATVIAWFYLGKQAVRYLTIRCFLPAFFSRFLYPFCFLSAVLTGGMIRSEAVWLFSDLWNGLMAFPNLTALLFLSGEIPLPGRWGKKPDRSDVPLNRKNASPDDDTFFLEKSIIKREES